MLQFVRWGLAACAMLGATFSAQAQTYPDRPVKLVIAFVPGGATDTFARQISNDLAEADRKSVERRVGKECRL